MSSTNPFGFEVQQSAQNAIDARYNPEFFARPFLSGSCISPQPVEFAIGPDDWKKASHKLSKKLHLKSSAFQLPAKPVGRIAAAMKCRLVEIAPQ